MPASDAVYDGRFHASPQCWSVFAGVLQSEFQDALLFGRVHQLTVDAYAAQHAGGPHPDKSVCVHLVGLHLVLERGIAPVNVAPRLQQLASATSDWPRFEPPAERGPLTVFDVATSGSRDEHAARARAWAEQVWASWRAQHAAIAQIAEGCFRPDVAAPRRRR